MVDLIEDSVRQTKIVATLGPASDDGDVLERMLLAGVDVVRLNFSHGDHDKLRQRVEAVRKVCQTHNKTVALLADLQGPKIRIARFKDGHVTLREGEPFLLDAELDGDVGDRAEVGIDYKDLPDDVSAGDILLLDDGRIQLKVDSVAGTKVFTTVLVGGELSNNKGINLKGGGLSAKALTDKDREDLALVVELDLDYLAISFPRDAEDVLETKQLLADKGSEIAVIAKIERIEAMVNLNEIVSASDGVMVARGDLAVEIGDAEVPAAQRMIIALARSEDKPVITATQMMESMVTSAVPTRAEVSDVANAVLEATDAVMLSAETAVGEYPVKVVEAMDRVCRAAEKSPQAMQARHVVEARLERRDEAIAMATMYLANHMELKGIIALTESGATPLWMSRIRSGIPIFGLSRSEKTCRRMALYRGVYPIFFDATKVDRVKLNDAVVTRLMDLGHVQKGDLVIITKGTHMGMHGGTCTMRIAVVGEPC